MITAGQDITILTRKMKTDAPHATAIHLAHWKGQTNAIRRQDNAFANDIQQGEDAISASRKPGDSAGIAVAAVFAIAMWVALTITTAIRRPGSATADHT